MALSKRVDNIDAPTQREFLLIVTRVDKLDQAMNALRKAMSGLKGGPVEAIGGADQDAVDRLEAELAKLRNDFERHAHDANSRLSDIDGILPTKADKSDLLDLQNAILDRVRQMIEQLLGQFATKEDVNRRLNQITKKIRELFDLLNRGRDDNDDTAMLSKKHLGPVACVSCEKNLVNLEAV